MALVVDALDPGYLVCHAAILSGPATPTNLVRCALPLWLSEPCRGCQQAESKGACFCLYASDSVTPSVLAELRSDRQVGGRLNL